MKDLSKFQLILFGAFIIAIFAAVVILAAFRASSTDNQVRSIVIWGTIPASSFDSFISMASNKTSITAKYYYKSSDALYQNLLEALASGQGPDVLFISDEELYQVRSKLVTIPFTSYSEGLYKSNFIEGTEVFLNQKGAELLPALIDPVVMYWNRDVFSAKGYINPPKYWDEFFALAQKISQHTSQLNITKSAVALGEFNNINNAKAILHTLIYQAGGKITSRESTGFTTALTATFSSARSPVASALDFYMQFSDPLKTSYSWNRTMSSSKDTFIAGDLAVYFGYASEINEIRAKNPNLNFDVAVMPQARGATVPMTHGKFYGFGLVRTANVNDSVALNDINILTSADVLSRVVTAQNFYPARRDLLSVAQPRADKAAFYQAIPTARTWIDPNPRQTNTIFSEIVSMISSGRLTTLEAIERADAQMGALLK